MILPYYHGILQQKPALVILIETDKTSITGSATAMEYTDYCAINVTPNTMATTITKVDTGAGTSWANLYPTSGTGDYSFRARMMDTNTGAQRTMIARITDNAGIATSVDIQIRQLAGIG